MGGLNSAPCAKGARQFRQVQQSACTGVAAAGPSGRAPHPVLPFSAGTPQSSGQQSLQQPHLDSKPRNGAEHCFKRSFEECIGAAVQHSLRLVAQRFHISEQGQASAYLHSAEQLETCKGLLVQYIHTQIQASNL